MDAQQNCLLWAGGDQRQDRQQVGHSDLVYAGAAFETCQIARGHTDNRSRPLSRIHRVQQQQPCCAFQLSQKLNAQRATIDKYNVIRNTRIAFEPPESVHSGSIVGVDDVAEAYNKGPSVSFMSISPPRILSPKEVVSFRGFITYAERLP